MHVLGDEGQVNQTILIFLHWPSSEFLVPWKQTFYLVQTLIGQTEGVPLKLGFCSNPISGPLTPPVKDPPETGMG